MAKPPRSYPTASSPELICCWLPTNLILRNGTLRSTGTTLRKPIWRLKRRPERPEVLPDAAPQHVMPGRFVPPCSVPCPGDGNEKKDSSDLGWSRRAPVSTRLLTSIRMRAEAAGRSLSSRLRQRGVCRVADRDAETSHYGSAECAGLRWLKRSRPKRDRFVTLDNSPFSRNETREPTTSSCRSYSFTRGTSESSSTPRSTNSCP